MSALDLQIVWLTPEPATPFTVDRALAVSSKSGYFAALVLPKLRERLSVECRSVVRAQDAAAVLDEYATNVRAVFVHQVEDAPASRMTRILAASVPGIAMFHDLYFAPLERNRLIRRANEHVLMQMQLPLSGAASKPETFAAFEAERAIVAVAPSERSVTELRTYRESLSLPATMDTRKSVWKLPYPVLAAASGQGIREHVPFESRHVAFCGSPVLEHRAPHVLQAVAALGMKLAWVCDPGEEQAARQLCAQFGVADVELIPNRSPLAWTEALHDAIAAVHCWLSGYGDPDPYLSISTGSGIPVVVHNYASTEEVAGANIHKIEPGLHEVQQIELALRTVVDSSRDVIRQPEPNLEFRSPSVIAAEFAALVQAQAQRLVSETQSFFRAHPAAALREAILQTDAVT